MESVNQSLYVNDESCFQDPVQCFFFGHGVALAQPIRP